MFPERQYQNALPVCLETLYKVSRKTVVQKGVRVNSYYPSVSLNLQSLFLLKYVALVDVKLVKLINVAYINIIIGYES